MGLQRPTAPADLDAVRPVVAGALQDHDVLVPEPRVEDAPRHGRPGFDQHLQRAGTCQAIESERQVVGHEGIELAVRRGEETGRNSAAAIEDGELPGAVRMVGHAADRELRLVGQYRP